MLSNNPFSYETFTDKYKMIQIHRDLKWIKIYWQTKIFWVISGNKGIKGTKKPVFLRHTHKDNAWKLRVGSHLRFKWENDFTLSVLFTNLSIQI